MRELEGLIGLVLAAVLVAAAARRVGAPYPVFLALGGALLAFLPGAPTLIVPPELALAMFQDACTPSTARSSEDRWYVVGLGIQGAGGLSWNPVTNEFLVSGFGNVKACTRFRRL
ncbi:MAG TPA: hypothetical protein VFB99_17145 [Vicinamibacterales bacterium]|jgi:CPA1 family monovalent cation:H+ antiporter|nr:hypothetical protein [Vicinamibacterales bacterium]